NNNICTCDHGCYIVMDKSNKRRHKKGYTNEQVQYVYDLAAEKMVTMIIEMAADYKADRELEKLVAQFGGEEKWKEVSRQLLAFGRKNLPGDVLETLSSSHEGVMALYRMMKGDAPAIGKNPAAQSGNPAELELQSMMRDPKYWRDQDPSFISKVTEGFKNLYGG